MVRVALDVTAQRERRRAAPPDGAHKHVQSGIALKDAVASIIDRVYQGNAVDSYSYVDVLQECFRQTDLESVQQVHDCIRISHLDQNPYVVNSLLKCYIRCGRLRIAQELFSTFSNKNNVSWTIMIGGYAEHDQADKAFETFKQLRSEGGQPDAVTYLTVLRACTSPVALKWGKCIHSHIVQDGFQADVRVCNALVHMYAKCGSVDDARMVFDKMAKRDVISWNAIIGGLARHGLGHEAFSLFIQMQKDGFVPDSVTYLNILNPCSSTDALNWVKEVDAQARKAGLDGDVRVGNALIHMYSKSGSIEGARTAFDRMKRRNVVSWTALIGGLAQHGLGKEAFSLFLQMQREGFTPNAVTYMSILNPCSSTGALEWVKEVHSYAMKAGLDVDLCVGNALVHMYAKIGSISNARQVFDRMPERDIVTWTAMIGGLAQHGQGGEALPLFEEMKSKGAKPNGVSFVAVLSACSQAGLVDEGHSLFLSMKRDYGIEPALEHYTCMVDLLGRAGRLEEAKDFILNMPMKPDLVTWGALLGACRVHNNIEVAELAAKECLKLDPKDPSTFVLLSNVYAAAGDWGQVSLIRSMMHKRGIREDSGQCWIEVDNKVHHFGVGDANHPETNEIYAVLKSLSEKLEAEGYLPDTRLVLRNIDDEDKEYVLCSHSERLAIGYGLMHVTPGKPIRINKNLRICEDCHTVAKLISKITGRDIVARDSNRFHHFKDGSCTCGD